MPRLIVTTRSGETRVLDGAVGLSVMEVLRDGGVEDVLALCGGVCSCATCHVHVAPEWLSRLPAMGGDEEDLLDGSSGRDDRSRLSCQIPFSAELDGLAVTVAAED